MASPTVGSVAILRLITQPPAPFLLLYTIGQVSSKAGLHKRANSQRIISWIRTDTPHPLHNPVFKGKYKTVPLMLTCAGICPSGMNRKNIWRNVRKPRTCQGRKSSMPCRERGFLYWSHPGAYRRRTCCRFYRRRPDKKAKLFNGKLTFPSGLNRWKPLIFQWIFQPVTIISHCPAGVQAQPSPRTLAMMFAAMYSPAGCPWGIRGNRNRRNGRIPLVSLSTSPAFPATSISPIHSATTPAIVMQRDTASPALSRAALVTSAMCPVAAP